MTAGLYGRPVTRSAAVAAGNRGTARAAVAVLRAGGNAFDAAVAAGFAAGVAEPTLSSLGGGGFLLAAPAGTEPVLFDFFVDAPGRGLQRSELDPHFVPVTLEFASTTQVFQAGWGSVAVPGCLAGYLHVHRRLGRLPLGEVVAPARQLARRGVVLDRAQADLIALLAGILTLSDEGRALFAPSGRLVATGDRVHNPDLAGFLGDVAEGRVRSLGDPSVADATVRAMAEGGGLVTAADLRAYAVVERVPLRARYRGGTLATNPPPSFGGAVVLDALTQLASGPALDGSPPSVERLARALVAMSHRHVSRASAVRGTTHISVVDGDGSVATMTTSNGTCSGRFLPGTGVQLNNVMGEADLHPDGFHVTPPGIRIGSMMAPTVVTTPDGTVVGLGSGGSERIRSALTCVLSGVLDRGLSLDAAVRAPRMHWDGATLQAEPGWDEDALAAVREDWPLHVWVGRDLYFGGAHAVARRSDGTVCAAGDPRRRGVGLTVVLG